MNIGDKIYAKENNVEKGLLKGKDYIVLDCWNTVFCIKNSFREIESFTKEEFQTFFSKA